MKFITASIAVFLCIGLVSFIDIINYFLTRLLMEYYCWSVLQAVQAAPAEEKESVQEYVEEKRDAVDDEANVGVWDEDGGR